VNIKFQPDPSYIYSLRMDTAGCTLSSTILEDIMRESVMNTLQRLFRIGALEKITNFPRRTILFYVSSGLLHAPVKTGKTMAYYDEAHYQKLLFIKNAKKKGLPLIAIRQMIERREAEGHSFGPHADGDFVLESSNLERLKKPRKVMGKSTRDKILREGSHMFREKGFKNTKVSNITHSLNIGKGSFYSYFSNKEELFLECVPLMFEEFFSKGWEAIRKEKDPYRRLVMRIEISMPVIGEFNTILQLSREAMKESGPNLRNLGERIYRSVYKPIKLDIERGIKGGMFRPVDARLYSMLMLGLLENADHILRMNADLSLDSVKSNIIDILTRSLRKEQHSEDQLQTR